MNAPLALPFAAGMLTVVNPCGFAMLPAYLGYFLGLEGEDKDLRAGVSRSIAVGLSVAAGFLLVFSVIAVATYHLSASINDWTPWATIVIGGALVVLGIAMIRGYEPILHLPKLDRGGRTGGVGSMFVFGMSFAIASFGCAFPLFSVNVVGTYRREDALASAATFIAYALGVTLVLLGLTISLGMARQGLLRWMRRALPFVTRASGVLLLLAGAYLVHYGWYERVVGANAVGEGSPVVDLVTGWSDSIADWIYRVGPTELGLVLALALGSVLVATLGTRARRQ
jgi:cytochrome c-type biogenesis protein